MSNITYGVSCDDCAGPNCAADFTSASDAARWAERHVCEEGSMDDYLMRLRISRDRGTDD